jgi:gas vesicle protein
MDTKEGGSTIFTKSIFPKGLKAQFNKGVLSKYSTFMNLKPKQITQQQFTRRRFGSQFRLPMISSFQPQLKKISESKIVSTTIRKFSDKIKRGFDELNSKITPGSIASFGKAKIDIIATGEGGIISNAPTIAAGLKKAIVKIFGETGGPDFVYTIPDLFTKLVNIFKYINTLYLAYTSLNYLKDNYSSLKDTLKSKISDIFYQKKTLKDIIDKNQNEFTNTNKELFDTLNRLEDEIKKINSMYDEQRAKLLQEISDKSKDKSLQKSEVKSIKKLDKFNEDNEEFIRQLEVVSLFISKLLDILDGDEYHIKRLSKSPNSVPKSRSIRSLSPIEEVDGGRRRTGKNKKYNNRKTIRK